jgi:hypothetical protein
MPWWAFSPSSCRSLHRHSFLPRRMLAAATTLVKWRINGAQPRRGQVSTLSLRAPTWRGHYLHGERSARPPVTTAEFFKRTLIVLLVALVPVLIWFLFDVILIVAGAILIAVLLHLVAEPFTRWCGLPQNVALICPAF